MTEYLGNQQLECEHLTGRILKGDQIPGPFTTLKIVFSSLPMVDAGDSEIILGLLQKKLVNKLGLLKDSEIENFYYGKNPELLEAVERIKAEVDESLPALEIASEVERNDYFDRKFQEVNSQEDVSDMVQILNSSSQNSRRFDELENRKIDSQVLQTKIETILDLYGKAERKIRDKDQRAMNPLELKEYLTQIERDMPYSDYDPVMVMTLYYTLSILSASIPNDELDPFRVDIMQSLYNVLCNPDDYYAYCKQEKIVDISEGKSFSECYPEYYKKFTNMYVDEYDDMDYQQQINFKKCFDLVEDNSDLVAMCSTSLTPPPPQPQGIKK